MWPAGDPIMQNADSQTLDYIRSHPLLHSSGPHEEGITLSTAFVTTKQEHPLHSKAQHCLQEVGSHQGWLQGHVICPWRSVLFNFLVTYYWQAVSSGPLGKYCCLISKHLLDFENLQRMKLIVLSGCDEQTLWAFRFTTCEQCNSLSKTNRKDKQENYRNHHRLKKGY